jgi:hypothetical protein
MADQLAQGLDKSESSVDKAEYLTGKVEAYKLSCPFAQKVLFE